MHTSPFQPPSPRQNVLAAQIEAAHAIGDRRRLLLLRGLWVHRFGVEALPEPQAGPSPFGQRFSLIQEPLEKPLNEENTSDQAMNDEPTFTACLAAVGDEAVGDWAVAEDDPGDRVLWDERRGDDVGSIDAGSDLEIAGAEPQTAAETPLLHVAMQKVPEPPLTTPRSLRRWLASDSESVPKAS